VVMKEIMLSRLDKFECVDKLCYLRDLIGACGETEEAPRARLRCTWAKFQELASVLTSRGFSQSYSKSKSIKSLYPECFGICE